MFVVALLPALAAIWWVSWFVTQDGPAHLYNAHIIARSFARDPWFGKFYRVRPQLFPNWAGHLAMLALLEVLPPREADRAMTSLTLIGFAASIVWLRWRVAGWRGMPAAALLAVILAMNVTWLLGFTGFLIGACLFPVTLGLWWAGRESPGPRRALVLGVLVTVGYFCHLISLALTVVGLGVLVAFVPGTRRMARLAWTAVGLVPLVPLGVIYLYLTGQGGPMRPEWENLTDPFSLLSWSKQLGWIDPISLARKMVFPFVAQSNVGFIVLAPVVWLAIGLVLAVVATVRSGRSADRRGWAILAALLLVGGLVAPDTFGATHGNYMPQRVVLLGLVALVPYLDLEARDGTTRAAAVALVVAVAVQSAFLWEYAYASDRTAGALMRARAAVGTGNQVATLLIHARGRFRANPLRHADNLLGVNTGNILWNNYETLHYYFPVQFVDGLPRPEANTLEWIAVHDDPHDAEERWVTWEALLENHHRSIDRLVVWDDDPEANEVDRRVFDAINRRWFDPVLEQKTLKVLHHR